MWQNIKAGQNLSLDFRYSYCTVCSSDVLHLLFASCATKSYNERFVKGKQCLRWFMWSLKCLTTGQFLDRTLRIHILLNKAQVYQQGWFKMQTQNLSVSVIHASKQSGNKTKMSLESARSHVCDEQVCTQVNWALGFEPHQQTGWESDTGLPGQWG